MKIIQNERHKMIATIRKTMGFPWGYLQDLSDMELAQLYWTAEAYAKDWEETA